MLPSLSFTHNNEKIGYAIIHNIEVETISDCQPCLSYDYLYLKTLKSSSWLLDFGLSLHNE